METKQHKLKYFSAIAEKFIAETGSKILPKKKLLELADRESISPKDFYTYLAPAEFRHTRGKYDIGKAVIREEQEDAITAQPVNSVVKLKTQDTSDAITYVPEKSSIFIRWGNYATVAQIVESRQFFPTYIAGPSGNGKTFMVEQAAAAKNIKFMRVQLTPETAEDDLIGGFRLVDGSTVFCKGPVIRAMEEGALLLLDELDRASNKIMCLQSILEGKSVLIKKTGETVFPQPGFNIIATANTHGRGSDDGRYTAASIIDDAFLERFPITINHDWPTPAREVAILHNHMVQYDRIDKDFADKLVTWANIIRKTFADGGVDDEISTRRLCHIVQCFSIFDNRLESIRLAINRFSEESRESFLDLYTKVDDGAIPSANETTVECVKPRESENTWKNVNTADLWKQPTI